MTVSPYHCPYCKKKIADKWWILPDVLEVAGVMISAETFEDKAMHKCEKRRSGKKG